MTFGKRIKKIKEILKISTKQMADTTGIPKRTIGAYERDELVPSSKFLCQLLEIYHVNANWLLTGNGAIFLSPKEESEINFIASLQEQYHLSKDEVQGLTEILNSEATRDMVLKFIKIKGGNKDALDNLILNLQGIKAFLA